MLASHPFTKALLPTSHLTPCPPAPTPPHPPEVASSMAFLKCMGAREATAGGTAHHGVALGWVWGGGRGHHW